MDLLILSLSFLGLALGDDPPRCCSERQFEARLAEIGGALYDEHGQQVPALMNIDNVLHYDFYNKSVVYEIFEHTDQGKLIRSRIVHDFKKGFRYVIMNGNCAVSTGSRVMNEQCVPDHAKFTGATYLGYGINRVVFNSWQYEDASSGTKVKMAMTDNNCIPLFQSIFTPNGATGNDVVFTVTNFHPGIRKPKVFNLPNNCVTSSDVTRSVPSSVQKAQRYIDAVLSR